MNLFFDSIIVLYLIAALVFASATFRDRKIPGKWEHKHPKLVVGFSVALLFSFLVVIWGSFVEPRLITVNRVSIDLPNFEPTKPVRVALISDVHVGTYKKNGWVNRISERIMAEKPDLVLIAGDLVVSKSEHSKYLANFKLLTSSFPTYAVLGDHDYKVKKKPKFSIDESVASAVNEALTNAGVQVLKNDTKKINAGCTGLSPDEIRAKPCAFWLVGLDDWLAGKTDMKVALSPCVIASEAKQSHDLPAGKAGIATSPSAPRDDDTCTPIVALVHNPDFILDPQSKNADLILAGNTHGGQIRLPFIGPIPRLPSKLPRTFDEGLFTLENGTKLFITSGISESGPRARLFNPPEIVILELY